MNEEIHAKIEKFFSGYRSRNYSKGQILLLSGESSDYVYHLVKGKVKQYDVSSRGDEAVLNVFKPPAFFPMSLAINKSYNPFIFEAETDIEVRQAPSDEAVGFLKDNPDVMFDLLSRLYIGLDGLMARMSHLMASGAGNRLLHELVVECRRFGEESPDGSYLISIKEKDLASRAGLSRETVNREVSKLKQENLIIVNQKGITITDIKKLESKLGTSL